MRISVVILLLSLIFSIPSMASQDEVDSLVNLSFKETNDTLLLQLYNKIGSASYKRDQQLAKTYWSKALPMAKELAKKDTNQLFKKELTIALNGMGIISRREGDFSKALSYYQECLKIEREMDRTSGGNTLMNIGVIYREMQEYVKALEYVNESLDIAIKNKDRGSYSSCYNSLGMIYRRMKDYEGALECYNKSLEASIAIDDQDNIAQSYNNIGAVYYRQKKYDEALKSMEKGYAIHLANNNQAGIVRHHANMVAFHKKVKNYKKAMESAQFAYDAYKEMGRKTEQSNMAGTLSGLYKKQGKYDKALEYYKEYIALRDSVFNENNLREVAQKEMQFNFEKQKMADSLARAEAEKIKELEYQSEINQQKTFTYGGAIILFIVIVFSAMIYKRLKISNKQKEIIEEQKIIVEAKNKEIVDSINYAKRIQGAILPSLEKIKETLPDSFVLYQPKDIVAGDFYWYKERNGKILIAVADCTGHGVPGAMVSVVCHNALNRAVNDFKLTEPAKILDKTAELVIEAFQKSQDEVKDGMDICLCSFDLENNQLEYAGAINSLFYISENKLTEIKGDKQPIGEFAHMKPFTNHQISLSEGDKIYMFSDGYADQFGGKKGKKYMYKRFRDLILKVSSQDFSKQGDELKAEFENWRGDLEQLDDVCVIGVKV